MLLRVSVNTGSPQKIGGELVCEEMANGRGEEIEPARVSAERGHDEPTAIAGEARRGQTPPAYPDTGFGVEMTGDFAGLDTVVPRYVAENQVAGKVFVAVSSAKLGRRGRIVVSSKPYPIDSAGHRANPIAIRFRQTHHGGAVVK